MANAQLITSQSVTDWLVSKWQNTEQAKSTDSSLLYKEVMYATRLVQDNYSLQSADVVTVARACIDIVLSGLTLNPVMQQAYLVPFKGKVAVMPSYRGLCHLAFTCGSVSQILAQIVYEKDTIIIDLADTVKPVTHQVYLRSDKGEMLGVYAQATLESGTKQAEWMDTFEIQGIQDLSEGYKRKGAESIWGLHFGEMARKTVVKRLVKYLPKVDSKLSRAIELDNEVNEYDLPVTATDCMNLDELYRRTYNALAESKGKQFAENIWAKIQTAQKQSDAKAIYQVLSPYKKQIELEGNLDERFKLLTAE